MPLYVYRGLDKSGKNKKGTIDSENLRTARLKLKKQGIYVVDIKDKTKASKKAKGRSRSPGGSVSVKDLSMMTRQLATLLKANIPLVESLGAVADQVENQYLSDVLAEIKNMVNEGATLHRSMQKYPKVFDKIFVSMCEAGEMSGTLDIILIRLAEFKEAQSELRSKITSAMLYPIIMVVFIGLILIGIFTFVIPKIVTVLEASPELVLPWYTKVVISISDAFVDYWHIMLVAVIAFGLVFKNWKNSPSGSKQWDLIVLNLPVVGKIARMIAVSRFTRTLSTLLVGGVPMLSAMGIVRNVVDNEVLGEAIDEARDNISEGESIAGPLKKSNQFPPL